VNLGFAGAAGWGGEAGRQGKCRQHKAQQHKASQVCLLHYLPSVGSILGKVCVPSVEIFTICGRKGEWRCGLHGAL